MPRLRGIYCALRYRRIATFGSGIQIQGRLTLTGDGHITIGDNVSFAGRNRRNQIIVADGAIVTVGRDCYVNGVEIIANARVVIGDRCIIGDSTIVTTDFHPVGRDRRSPNAFVRTGPVVIGDNVWLAGRSVVLRGVTIGDDSVVAMGTIVTKDVPSGVVVAGQRMRVVRRLDPDGSDPEHPTTSS